MSFAAFLQNLVQEFARTVLVTHLFVGARQLQLGRDPFVIDFIRVIEPQIEVGGFVLRCRLDCRRFDFGEVDGLGSLASRVSIGFGCFEIEVDRRKVEHGRFGRQVSARGFRLEIEIKQGAVETALLEIHHCHIVVVERIDRRNRHGAGKVGVLGRFVRGLDLRYIEVEIQPGRIPETSLFGLHLGQWIRIDEGFGKLALRARDLFIARRGFIFGDVEVEFERRRNSQCFVLGHRLFRLCDLRCRSVTKIEIEIDVATFHWREPFARRLLRLATRGLGEFAPRELADVAGHRPGILQLGVAGRHLGAGVAIEGAVRLDEIHRHTSLARQLRGHAFVIALSHCRTGNAGRRSNTGLRKRRSGRSALRSGVFRILTVEGIVRVKLAPHGRRLLPVGTLPLSLGVEFRGGMVELLDALALRIDLEQLEVYRGAARIRLDRIEEDFFGLGITPVGHVDVGLGDRINPFVRVDRSHPRLAEIGLDDTAAGIHALTTAGAEDRGATERKLGCNAALRMTGRFR